MENPRALEQSYRDDLIRMNLKCNDIPKSIKCIGSYWSDDLIFIGNNKAGDENSYLFWDEKEEIVKVGVIK